MRAFFAALVVLAAAPAFAGVTLTLQTGAQDSVSVGQNSCGAQVAVNYQITAPSPCNDVQLWLTKKSTCTDQPSAADGDLAFDSLTQEEVFTSPTGTVFFRVNALPSFTAEVPCGTPDLEVTHRVCASYQSQEFDTLGGTRCSTSYSKPGSPPRVIYDSKPPPQPVITNVTPRDSALTVDVASADAVRVRVFVKPAAELDAPFTSAAEGAGNSSIEVKNLVNGLDYELRAVAEDAAGNVSAESVSAFGAPVRTIGFWGAYCSAGNECEGGCGAAVGGPTLLGLMLALSALRRRKS